MAQRGFPKLFAPFPSARHIIRLSMTRFALPSLRSMDLGSKRVIFAAMFKVECRASAMVCSTCSKLRTVSANIVSFIST